MSSAFIDGNDETLNRLLRKRTRNLCHGNVTGRRNQEMDIKLFATVFGTIFLAELGDKTQLATLLFASKAPANLLTVFIGASLALIMTSLIGVAAGALVSQYVDPKYLSYAAGVGFVVVGVWTIWQA